MSTGTRIGRCALVAVAAAIWASCYVWFFPIVQKDETVVSRESFKDSPQKHAPRAEAAILKTQWHVRNEALLGAPRLEQAGRYSLYARTPATTPRQVSVWVNGVEVTSVGLYRIDGEPSGSEKIQRLASRVPMRAGVNEILLYCENGRPDFSAVILRPELPWAWDRWALAFLISLAATGACLFASDLFTRKVLVTDPRRLVAVAAVYVTILIALVAFIWHSSGKSLVELGYKVKYVPQSTQRLQKKLEEISNDPAQRQKYLVCVFGDSSHGVFYSDEEKTVGRMQSKLTAEQREKIDIEGYAQAGFSAFDYYFLLNLVAEYKPNLLVLPVALRTFSEERLAMRESRVPSLLRYVEPSEYLNAIWVSTPHRRVAWHSLLLYRAERELTNCQGAPFLRGNKVYYESEEKRILNHIEKRIEPFGVPMSPGVEEKAPVPKWDTHVSPDHELFRVFRAINRLAQKNNIQVLYYGVATNIAAQKAEGVDLRFDENMTVIRDCLLDRAGIRYLDITHVVPDDAFFDDEEHYLPAGMEAVSTHLLDEVLRIAREEKPDIPLSE